MSLVARRALSQWNKMNSIIRKHAFLTKVGRFSNSLRVYTCIITELHNVAQFEGAGGFVRSEGTTNEQAISNQMLRQAITSEQE